MSRDELLTQHQGLIKSMAISHQKKHGGELEDLNSAATVGFLTAFEGREWDPDISALTTFVWPYVLDALCAETGTMFPVRSVPKDIINGQRRNKTGKTFDDLGINAYALDIDSVPAMVELKDDPGYEKVDAAVTATADVAALRVRLSPSQAHVLDLWIEHSGDLQVMANRIGVDEETMALKVQKIIDFIKN